MRTNISGLYVPPEGDIVVYDGDGGDGAGQGVEFIAAIKADIVSGAAPLKVNFGVVVSSGVVDSDIFWEFGDGVVDALPYVSGKLNVPHTFTNAGSYIVNASAYDGYGKMCNIASVTINASAVNSSNPTTDNKNVSEAGFGGMTGLLLAGAALAMIIGMKKKR